MARNGSGVYSKPGGTTAVSGTTISSSDFNTLMDDIAADLNAPRPVVAGGTGGNDVSSAQTALGLLIGTDVQAYNINLDYLSALTTAGEEGKVITIDTGAFSTETLLAADPQAGDESKRLVLNATRDGVDFESQGGTRELLDVVDFSTAGFFNGPSTARHDFPLFDPTRHVAYEVVFAGVSAAISGSIFGIFFTKDGGSSYVSSDANINRLEGTNLGNTTGNDLISGDSTNSNFETYEGYFRINRPDQPISSVAKYEIDRTTQVPSTLRHSGTWRQTDTTALDGLGIDNLSNIQSGFMYYFGIRA